MASYLRVEDAQRMTALAVKEAQKVGDNALDNYQRLVLHEIEQAEATLEKLHRTPCRLNRVRSVLGLDLIQPRPREGLCTFGRSPR